jgi:hypothetical protein
VDKAHWIGKLCAGVTSRELLLLVHAVAWASEYVESDGGIDRLLDLVFSGLRPS